MPSQPRVVIVMRGDELYGGGAERRFWRLFLYMREAGQDVHLITNEQLLKYLERIARPRGNQLGNVHVFKDENSRAFRVFSKWMGFNLYAIDTIKALRPAVVHLVLIQRSLIPLYLWLWTQRRIKVVSTMAFSYFAYRSRVPLSTALAAYLIWKRADVIDSLYPAFKTSAPKRYQHKVVVAPCSFTDVERFKPAVCKENAIVFAGRLNDEKNPLLLVKALALLKQNYPDILRGWKVYILGRGPLEKIVKEYIIQYKLNETVEVDHVDCISDYLNKARLFVTLQRTENYPSQSLLEAMSAGCAVIATDVGDTRRLIDGKTGLLVGNNNPFELAEVMKKLVQDPDLCYTLGQAARERVTIDHSLERFADYLWSLWRV